MVRANALFIVLVISLLVALISSSLILVSYHYSTVHYQTRLYKRLLSNAQSGINYLLAEEGEVSLNEEIIIDLYGKENDSVALKRMNWGVFDLAVVRAFSGNQQVIRILEYGYKPDAETKSAIYMADLNRPLSLCGNTVIKGTCYLPESGVRRDYIEGQSFMGDKLIQGEIKKSKNSLPELKKDIKEKLLSLLEDKLNLDEFEQLQELDIDTVRRSFTEKTLLLKQKTHLSIKNLYGNILITSDTILKIGRDANLEDVIIAARAVEIESGFKGKLQIFAVDSVLLGENVELNYPSVIGLFKKDFKVMQPFIKVSKGGKVNGIVFSSQSVFDLKQTLISIEKDAFLHGQLYSDGFADIQGKVYGSVFCNKFRLKTSSSLYENYLLNTTIDATKLSPYFIESALLSSEKKKRVIKWLN
ncbi:MAG: hypothetical protein NVV82_19285 [Sporocytophaga sp.]|nr:hypothetical protein [Sporocytophaga sp.]